MGQHQDEPGVAPLLRSILGERSGGAQGNAAWQLDPFPALLQPLVLLSRQVPAPQPHGSVLGGKSRGGERPCREGLTALGRGLGARGRPAPHCTHTSKPQQPRKGNTAAAAAGGCSQAGQRGSLNPFPTTSMRLLESWEAAGERNPPEGQASPRRIPPSLKKK